MTREREDAYRGSGNGSAIPPAIGDGKLCGPDVQTDGWVTVEVAIAHTKASSNPNALSIYSSFYFYPRRDGAGRRYVLFGRDR